MEKVVEKVVEKVLLEKVAPGVPRHGGQMAGVKRRRAAQSTVEYVLVISVLVVAMVTAAWYFMPGFSSGFSQMVDKSEELLQAGTSDGSNNMR